MRPIDADKFEVVGGIVPEGYDVDSYLAGNREILEMIDNAPTVDAVEVVRCRDCIHWQPEPTGDVMMCFDGAFGRYTEPDWFCADGRRKYNDG